MAVSMYRQGIALRGFVGTLGGCGRAVGGSCGRSTGHICKGKSGEAYHYSQAKESPEPCSSAVVHQITSAPWVNAPLSYVCCLASRHSFETCTTRGAATAQRLAANYNPALEPSQIPFCSYYHSLRELRAPNTDVRVQSVMCVPDEKVSVHLLHSNRGREEKTQLEVPYSQLDHLEELLVAQIAQTSALMNLKPDHSCRTALLLSHLESIVNSVTTVDGHKEDDIAVRHQSGPQLVPSPDDKPVLQLSGSAPSCSEHGKLGSPIWDMSGWQLDSFRSLFETEFCRMPFHSPDCVHQRSDVLSFHATTALENAERTKKNEPSMEEHLAVMYEKLRLELPNFFLKTHDYGIYSQDVEFVSGFLHMKTRGRTMYQAALTFCRFLAWNYFADIQMEVLKLTQHPENWTIQARWRITGLPFHVLMLRFYRRDKTELYRTYDAYSTFYLRSDGLIHCHKVDRIMPVQPPVNKVKTLLATALIALGLKEHRPALNLLLAQLALKLGQKPC